MTELLHDPRVGIAQIHTTIDEIEGRMAQNPLVECPLKHTFTPGLYARQIFMPAGTLVTSKIHRTRHQFIVSHGRVSVYNALTREVETYEAPYHGITEPGTRRILFNHTDVIWTTLHPTEETDLDVIEAMIIEPHDNPFLKP